MSQKEHAVVGMRNVMVNSGALLEATANSIEAGEKPEDFVLRLRRVAEMLRNVANACHTNYFEKERADLAAVD